MFSFQTLGRHEHGGHTDRHQRIARTKQAPNPLLQIGKSRVARLDKIRAARQGNSLLIVAEK